MDGLRIATKGKNLGLVLSFNKKHAVLGLIRLSTSFVVLKLKLKLNRKNGN